MSLLNSPKLKADLLDGHTALGEHISKLATYHHQLFVDDGEGMSPMEDQDSAAIQGKLVKLRDAVRVLIVGEEEA